MRTQNSNPRAPQGLAPFLKVPLVLQLLTLLVTRALGTQVLPNLQILQLWPHISELIVHYRKDVGFNAAYTFYRTYISLLSSSESEDDVALQRGIEASLDDRR